MDFQKDMISVTPSVETPELCQRICKVRFKNKTSFQNLPYTLNSIYTKDTKVKEISVDFESNSSHHGFTLFTMVALNKSQFSFHLTIGLTNHTRLAGCNNQCHSDSQYSFKKAEPRCVALTWTDSFFPVFPLRF